MIAARELLCGCGKQTRKSGSRVGGFVIEDAEEPATGRNEVRLRCLAVEFLLAAEGIVKARRADPHGGDQIVERRALVAALPEQLHPLPSPPFALEYPPPSPPA